MKRASLRKEYYWMEIDDQGHLSNPRPASTYDKGYFYLNVRDVIDKNDALIRLQKYYENGGCGEYILLEKYKKDNRNA